MGGVRKPERSAHQASGSYVFPANHGAGIYGMSFLLAAFVAVGFAGILHVARLPRYAREVAQRSRSCMEVVRDGSMRDEAKEKALQRQARRLLVLFGILAGGSVLALALPLGVVWLLDRMGAASFDATLAMLERPDFLGGTVIVGLLGYFLYTRLR